MLSARPGAPRQQDSPQAGPSDEYAARALAINGALSSGSLQGLDAPARPPCSRSACLPPLARSRAPMTSGATGYARLPTRPPVISRLSELEHVWASIEASACAQRVSAESRSWLALLRAVAMRDATAMRAAGESLDPVPRDVARTGGPGVQRRCGSPGSPLQRPGVRKPRRYWMDTPPTTSLPKCLPAAPALVACLREHSIVLRALKSQDAGRPGLRLWNGRADRCAGFRRTIGGLFIHRPHGLL